MRGSMLAFSEYLWDAITSWLGDTHPERQHWIWQW
jgi:hypothetical protein